MNIPECPHCDAQAWCAHTSAVVRNLFGADIQANYPGRSIPAIERELDPDSTDEALHSNACPIDYIHCTECGEDLNWTDHAELLRELGALYQTDVLNIDWHAAFDTGYRHPRT